MKKIILFLITASVLICNANSSPSIFNYDEWIEISQTNGEELPHPLSQSWQEQDSRIYVAIASYRDNRCAVTLKNLFTKAKNPARLHIGIVQQVHTEEDSIDCIAAYCVLQGVPRDSPKCPYRSQISTIVLSHQDSRGPSYARTMQADMMKQGDEEFCLQLDSHSDVVSDWDVEMTAMWGSIGNEYAILSTVPPDLARLDSGNRNEVPHLCQAAFTNSGMVQNLPPASAKDLTKPLLASLWSAGFSFGKCHAEVKVPYDPSLLYITEGEEFSRYARLWTRGYDVYTPNKILVVHDYSGAQSKIVSSKIPMFKDKTIDSKGWLKRGMTQEYRWERYDSGLKRIKTLLGMEAGSSLQDISDLTVYGLGLVRSLDQFIQFTGIDTKRKLVFGDRCKSLDWVPFTVPNTDPYVDNTDVWLHSAEIVKAGRGIPLTEGQVNIARIEGLGEKKALSKKTSNMRGLSTDPLRRRLVGLRSESLDLSNSMKLVEQKVEEASGELWWIFQAVDVAVENFIEYVDSTVESKIGDNAGGHGHRVLRFILIFAPMFVLVVFKTVQLLMTSHGTAATRPDIKRV